MPALCDRPKAKAGELKLINNPLTLPKKFSLSKSANHRNMAPLSTNRKEVIQCLIVFSPVGSTRPGLLSLRRNFARSVRYRQDLKARAS